MAFPYAYVYYFDIDRYLFLLTTSSDAFCHLKDCRVRIGTVLLNSNVCGEVQRSLVDGGMHIEDLLAEPSSRACAVSPHLGQPRPGVGSPGRMADGFVRVLVVQLDYGIS